MRNIDFGTQLHGTDQPISEISKKHGENWEPFSEDDTKSNATSDDVDSIITDVN